MRAGGISSISLWRDVKINTHNIVVSAEDHIFINCEIFPHGDITLAHSALLLLSFHKPGSI